MNALVEEMLSDLVDLAFRPYKIVYGSVPKEIDRKNVAVTIHRLKKRGFIEERLMEDEICIRLTQKGVEELEKRKRKREENRLLNRKPTEEKWDGYFRVVVFDIPENNKRIRNVLRQTLKVLEFNPLQKSVWVSKRNYTEEFRRWVRDLRLSQFVLIFETKDLGLLHD